METKFYGQLTAHKWATLNSLDMASMTITITMELSWWRHWQTLANRNIDVVCVWILCQVHFACHFDPVATDALSKEQYYDKIYWSVIMQIYT